MQTYISHCEDYEDSDELQLAMLEARKALRDVTARREREAREVATLQQAQLVQQAATAEHPLSPEKRKREDEAETNGMMPEQKKVRAEEPLPSIPESEPLPVRRDRENATVIVKNLPQGIAEHRVRQFFRHVSHCLFPLLVFPCPCLTRSCSAATSAVSRCSQGRTEILRLP